LVARVVANQLRPLLVAWLLLTLPVVCHHQTAVVVLGALMDGASHVLPMKHLSSHHGALSGQAQAAVQQHGAASGHGDAHGHQHGGSAPHDVADDATSTARAAVALAADLPQPPTDAPLWCANHANGADLGLPAGQDSLARPNPPDSPPDPRHFAGTASPEWTAPSSRSQTPPAPPPRLSA
jgi:hypothetical protein